MKTSTSSFLRTVTVVSVIAIFPAASVFAQKTPGGGSTSRKPSGASGPGAAARKQVADAQTEVNKAVAARDKIRAKLKASLLESKPELKQADDDFNKAKADLSAATKAVTDASRAKPEYVALREKVNQADKILADGNATAAAREAAEKDREAATTQMLQMDRDAQDTDEKVAEARSRQADAKKKADVLNIELDRVCQSDKDWQQANKAVDTADEKLKQARLAASKASAESSRPKPKSDSGSSSPPRRTGGGGGGY